MGWLALRHSVSVCFFASLLSVLTAQAQITNLTNSTSTPIPGAGHDYLGMLNETVNPGNGSVSVRIPIPVPPGRGLSVPLTFAYDSNGVIPPWDNSSPTGWGSNAGFLSQGGWTYTVPLLGVRSGELTKTIGSPPITYHCFYWYDYIFLDTNGTRHPMGMVGLQTPDSCAKLFVPHLDGGDGGFIGNAQDTSGSVQLADADGTVFQFSNPKNHTGLSGSVGLPSSIEDRNGNQVVVNDLNNGAFSYVDTLGRTVISSSGFGSGTTTLTASGLQPYQIIWGTASSNFQVGWNLLTGGDPTYCLGFKPGTNTLNVVKTITLPNSQTYQFSFDGVYGLLSRITYPGGGWVQYTWGVNPLSEFGAFSNSLNTVGACPYHYDVPAVTKRTVSFDGVKTALEQDFSYSVAWNSTGSSWTSKQTTVVTKDLLRGTSFSTVYNYSPYISPSQPHDPPIRYATQIPLEQQIVHKDSVGNVVRTTNKTWSGIYELLTSQSVLENGQTSEVDFQYGPGLQVTEKDEYDYGSGVRGALLRKTVNNYASLAATPIYPSGPSIFDKPCQQIVYDGSGSRAAETDNFYDGGTTVCGTAPTQALPGSGSYTGHDETLYGTSATVPRGNLTKTTKQCFEGSTTCSNPVTTYTYDEAGQALSMTDPKLNTTQYSYADNYQSGSGTPPGNTNAYLTTITHPTVNGVTQHEHFQYTYSDGQLTQSQDDNDIAAGKATTYLYNDTLRRLTETDFPDGGQTELAYNDAAPNPTVTTCKLINGTAGATCSASSPPSGWMVSLAKMDGIGHAVETQITSDPEGTDFTDTVYDGEGHVFTRSNPHRSFASATDGTTTYIYDSLGRIKNVAEPDGSNISTTYSGNQTTVTDEAQNQRKSQNDALGRLMFVREAPNNIAFNFETDYQYDTLNNLVCAVQKGTDTTALTNCASAPSTWRPRSFAYDSLSRLKSATNPETGTINYSYDLNGNVSSRVAPKPNQTSTATVTTNYMYDVLNRLTQKSYVNITTTAVKYAYDGSSLSCPGPSIPTITGASNLIGRRSAMCTGLSASAFSYDPMGRPIERRANKGSVAKTYSVNYTYYKDGSVNKLTYPSGDIVTYTEGDAGRVTQVSDSTNNYVGYSGRPATYSPRGALATMVNGHTSTFAGIVTSNIYNDRLQPVLLSASVSATPVFSLCYDFHLGMAINNPPCSFPSYTSGDNGNVFQVLNNVDSTRSAAFKYDPLNRLSQANTVTTSGANCWGEVYTTDAWGNLTNRAGVSGMTGCSTEGLSASASTKNQLSGISYDAAGNVTNDGNGNQPTYNAENRMSTDAGMTYSYDADGVRMEKSSGTSGTMYWPGQSGEYLAETDLTGTINEEYVYFNGARIARIDRPSGTVHYYFSDHLGSASVISDGSGNVQQHHYYYPYGGLISSIGSDTNHYKFSGKERDSESGLDNFGARYHASSMGRWMSPDAINITNDRVLNPANTLNKYVYGGNNPLKYIDPDGRDITIFYDAGLPTGHVMLAAYNQQTGDFTFMSVGPQRHLDPGALVHPLSGVPGTSEYRLPTSADELRQNFQALTIQTTPEVAQQAIDAIRQGAGTGNWAALGNNCTTSCVKLLKDLGLSPGSNLGLPWTPDRFWENIKAKYGNSASPFSRFLANTIGAGSFSSVHNGTDFGSPRYGMNTFDWLTLMLHSAPEGTVTTTERYWIDCGKPQNRAACN